MTNAVDGTIEVDKDQLDLSLRDLKYNRLTMLITDTTFHTSQFNIKSGRFKMMATMAIEIRIQN